MMFNLFQRVLQRSCLLVLIAIICLPAYAQEAAPKTYGELTNEETACLNAWLKPQNFNIEKLINNAILPSNQIIFPAITLCRGILSRFSERRTNVPCEYKGEAYNSCDEFFIFNESPDNPMDVNGIARAFGENADNPSKLQSLNAQIGGKFFPNKSEKSNDMPSAGSASAAYQYTLKDHGICAYFFGKLQEIAAANNRGSDAQKYFNHHTQVLEKARAKGWSMKDLLASTQDDGYLLLNIQMLHNEYGDKCIYLRRGLPWTGRKIN